MNATPQYSEIVEKIDNYEEVKKKLSQLEQDSELYLFDLETNNNLSQQQVDIFESAMTNWTTVLQSVHQKIEPLANGESIERTTLDQEQQTAISMFVGTLMIDVYAKKISNTQGVPSDIGSLIRVRKEEYQTTDGEQAQITSNPLFKSILTAFESGKIIGYESEFSQDKLLTENLIDKAQQYRPESPEDDSRSPDVSADQTNTGNPEDTEKKGFRDGISDGGKKTRENVQNRSKEHPGATSAIVAGVAIVGLRFLFKKKKEKKKESGGSNFWKRTLGLGAIGMGIYGLSKGWHKSIWERLKDSLGSEAEQVEDVTNTDKLEDDFEQLDPDLKSSYDTLRAGNSHFLEHIYGQEIETSLIERQNNIPPVSDLGPAYLMRLDEWHDDTSEILDDSSVIDKKFEGVREKGVDYAKELTGLSNETEKQKLEVGLRVAKRRMMMSRAYVQQLEYSFLRHFISQADPSLKSSKVEKKMTDIDRLQEHNIDDQMQKYFYGRKLVSGSENSVINACDELGIDTTEDIQPTEEQMTAIAAIRTRREATDQQLESNKKEDLLTVCDTLQSELSSDFFKDTFSLSLRSIISPYASEQNLTKEEILKVVGYDLLVENYTTEVSTLRGKIDSETGDVSSHKEDLKMLRNDLYQLMIDVETGIGLGQSVKEESDGSVVMRISTAAGVTRKFIMEGDTLGQQARRGAILAGIGFATYKFGGRIAWFTATKAVPFVLKQGRKGLKATGVGRVARNIGVRQTPDRLLRLSGVYKTKEKLVKDLGRGRIKLSSAAKIAKQKQRFASAGSLDDYKVLVAKKIFGGSSLSQSQAELLVRYFDEGPRTNIFTKAEGSLPQKLKILENYHKAAGRSANNKAFLDGLLNKKLLGKGKLPTINRIDQIISHVERKIALEGMSPHSARQLGLSMMEQAMDTSKSIDIAMQEVTDLSDTRRVMLADIKRFKARLRVMQDANIDNALSKSMDSYIDQLEDVYRNITNYDALDISMMKKLYNIDAIKANPKLLNELMTALGKHPGAMDDFIQGNYKKAFQQISGSMPTSLAGSIDEIIDIFDSLGSPAKSMKIAKAMAFKALRTIAKIT